jgi:hypothetical protein
MQVLTRLTLQKYETAQGIRRNSHIPPECPKLCLASSCSMQVSTIRPERRSAPPTPHVVKRRGLMEEESKQIH